MGGYFEKEVMMGQRGERERAWALLQGKQGSRYILKNFKTISVRVAKIIIIIA